MLGKIEGLRRRAQQRMRWLDGTTTLMYMTLSKFQELVMNRDPGVLQSMGSQKVGHNSATELNWTRHGSSFHWVRQGCGPCDQFDEFSVTLVFILPALGQIRIRSLWKLPVGRDWLGGKLGLVLMGGTMPSKGLIQFSVDGRGCFPPCCLTWDPTKVEVMKIMATSFQRSQAGTAALSAPDPAAVYCWPTPLPGTPRDTHGQAWVSPLWGPCSFLPGPGVHKILFVPSKSLVPQSRVSSVIKSHWPPESNSLGVLSSLARSPGW